MGSDRSVRRRGRARHQLHRHRRVTQADRGPGLDPGGATQHARRLRRRGHAPGLRPPRSPAPRPRDGAGTGRRRRDRRWSRHADGDAPLDAAQQAVVRPSRREPLRRGSAVLPRVSHARRRLAGCRCDRAAVLCAAARRPRALRGAPRNPPARSRGVAASPRAVRGGRRDPKHGRLASSLRRHGCLCQRSGRPTGCRNPAAPRGPRDVPRRERRPAARTAPRFSLTDLPPPEPARVPGQDTAAVLGELGMDPADIRTLVRAGVVGASLPAG